MHRAFFCIGAWCAAILCSPSLTCAADDPGQPGHVDHMLHATPDQLGRSLYGMKHVMDPAMTKELQDKVALYKNYTPAQLALSMDQMGHEYTWYISPASLKSSQGVLILLHGFREKGDKLFKERVQEPLGNIFPTALGIGMAMTMSAHIQVGLDQLQKAGATEIVVLPIVSTQYSDLYRQWQYIFGRVAKAEYASVPRVKTNAKLHFVLPPGDDAFAAEILLD